MALHSYNRLAIHGPARAPFLFLGRTLEILLAIQFVFDKLGFFPSLSHNFNIFTHHVLLINISCNTAAVGFGYTFVIGGSYLLRVFHPLDKSRTRVQVWYLVLFVLQF